jgi:DNA-binding response OmpR family regulator
MPDNRFRMLLIEDNEADALLVEDYVDNAGNGQFILRRAKTLFEAHRIFREFRPQIVLLDINLPDSKGIDTLKEFCKAGACGQEMLPPIVVLTSLDDHDVADEAVATLAQDYLVKADIDADVLLRSIRFAIQRHGRAEMNRVLSAPSVPENMGREAMEVLQRVNRTAPGEVNPDLPTTNRRHPEGSALILEHFTTGQQATEVIVTSLDQRLSRLEELQRDQVIGDARREVLWGQLERLLIGNGKGPLAARLETLERILVAKADVEREQRGRRWQLAIAVAVLSLGWLGSVIAWIISLLLQRGR